jgi:ribose 5-phosphate isomerase A
LWIIKAFFMHLSEKEQTEIKRRLGKEAASYVEEGMLVGLGTGSTAACFIHYLSLRCQSGLKITAVSSSEKSLELARAGGIPTIDMTDVTSIDLTIDGADEVDPRLRLIKGGGGAHVREKILASTSKKMLVIIDESKLVSTLGKCGLPIEILPFGYHATIAKLHRYGFDGKLRMTKEGSPYKTDNGNYIFDIRSPDLFPHPEEVHDLIIQTPGVLDTGFFFNLASSLLIGYADGSCELR